MAGSINLARVSASERATERIIADAVEVGADTLDRSTRKRRPDSRESPRERVETVPKTGALSAVGRAQNSLKRIKGGGNTDSGAVVPLFVRGSLMNEPIEERDCLRGSSGDVLCDQQLDQVNRAAPFAARVVVGAIVGSSDGGIWGVSDPLCHPPITVPGRVFGGSLTPQLHVTFVRRSRACP